MKPIGCSLVIFLCLGLGSLRAQSVRDPFHDADGNTFHQLFLDFRATQLIEMQYATDSSCAEGTLSPDGFSVVIRNYPGNRSVRVKVLDEQGKEREVTRSKCFIDPVLLEL
jgi:hypothetical protein